MDQKEKLRLDKYLWAIRIFKTRSLASEAIAAGKVRKDGTTVKPARPVGVGDQYEIRTETEKIRIEVTGLLGRRVQHSEAIQYYVDLTSEMEKLPFKPAAFVFNTGKRQSKKGRPTKKEKRNLDKFLE